MVPRKRFRFPLCFGFVFALYFILVIYGILHVTAMFSSEWKDIFSSYEGEHTELEFLI